MTDDKFNELVGQANGVLNMMGRQPKTKLVHEGPRSFEVNMNDNKKDICMPLTYCIVETDNFGRDYPDEKFVCKGIPTKEMAELICDAINNSKLYRVYDRWHIVRDSNYKLQPGFDP